MINKTTLQKMSNAIDKAKSDYWNAVKQNLIEISKELPIVDNDPDREDYYPNGLMMRVPNKHGQLVDCVYDMVAIRENRAMFHQSYWNFDTTSYWQPSDEIGYEDLITLCDYIEWPED